MHTPIYVTTPNRLLVNVSNVSNVTGVVLLYLSVYRMRVWTVCRAWRTECARMCKESLWLSEVEATLILAAVN